MTFVTIFFTVMTAIFMVLGVFEYTRDNHASAAFTVTAANTMLIAMVLLEIR